MTQAAQAVRTSQPLAHRQLECHWWSGFRSALCKHVQDFQVTPVTVVFACGHLHAGTRQRP